MKRISVVTSLLVALLAARADAVVIELLPVNQSGPVGTHFDVDVVISDLGSGAAPSVGAFDLDVSYDPSILASTGVAFGSLLGEITFFEAVAGSVAAGGVVDLFETSFLPAVALDALQPDSFVLATLSFQGLATGTSALVLTQTLVGDGNGDPLAVGASGASIRVVGAAVPEPGTVLILVVGLAAITASRRRAETRPNDRDALPLE